MENQNQELSPLALEMLSTTDEQLATYTEGADNGLIELAAVTVPEAPMGDNNHIGWPVATKSGDTLVVVHRRIPGHNPWGAGDGDDNSSFSLSRCSRDDGRTWSELQDLRGAMDTDYRNRGGALPLSHRYKFGPVNENRTGYKLHLNAIGTSPSGTVVLLCNYGAFRSEDKGATWQHLPDQFREDTTEGYTIYLGPSIINHPDLGLCAFGNTVGYGLGGGDTGKKFPNPVQGPVELEHHNLVVLNSLDEGRTWTKTIHELSFWAAQHEAAAVCHDGDIFILGRDQRTSTSYLQIRLVDGKPVDVRRANMRHTGALDTPDLNFNPVTGRFEMVRSFREGMLVDLWSIAPEDWESAEWQFEGVLFAKKQYAEEEGFYTKRDGFHPAGAVIDAAKGVQHIFIYTGHPNGPAGTFRLTRTLDTPKLKDFLDSSGKTD
jgi:hypothetical protein